MRQAIVGGVLVMGEMLAMVALLYLSSRTSGTLSTVLHAAALSMIAIGGWATWSYSRPKPPDE